MRKISKLIKISQIFREIYQQKFNQNEILIEISLRYFSEYYFKIAKNAAKSLTY